MKKLALVLLCAACGGGASVARPVPLPPSPAVHAPTEAERRAAVCGRDELAPLAAPRVASSVATTEGGRVLDAAVIDPAGQPVEARSEALAPINAGAPFDAAAAREATRRLWQTGRFADVGVEISPDRGGVHVIFRVTPRPTVARVFLAGDASNDDAIGIGLAPSKPYDPAAIVTGKRQLRESYDSYGLIDAKTPISSAFAAADRSSVDVCIRVKRGAVVKIESVAAHGSAYDRELDALLASEDTANVRGGVVHDEVLERDDLLLAAALYDRGLLSNRLHHEVVRHGDAIDVTFEIVDGPVYHYGKIAVRGQLAAPKAEYEKLLPFKRGAVFDRSEVVKALDAIRALDTSRGRPDLEVEPLTELDAAAGTVSLVVDVKGPPGFSTVDLKRGSGRAAKSGDTATLQYKGTLLDGTVFDSSAGRAPFSFKLGSGTVIQGFERGVLGMKVGGKRRVTIPPDLGYGQRGAPPKIPSNATLVFEIELLSIQ